MRGRKHYESDDATFPADAYRVKGHEGIAWSVLGWQTEPDEDTEWTGMENRTGMVVCIMVGDDRQFTFDPEDVKPLHSSEYCGSCGQIGCGHGAAPEPEPFDSDPFKDEPPCWMREGQSLS